MEGKTPPAQVAQYQDHLAHKYRSGMQQPNAGSTRARSALRWCPCASCIWLLHPAPILVRKVVLIPCNLCWWCFSFHQLAKILHLQSWSSSSDATCAGGVFPWSTSAFTNVRQTNSQSAQTLFILFILFILFNYLFTLHYHGKLQLALYAMRCRQRART